MDTGRERLLTLGYRQTLKRSITWRHTMAISMQVLNPIVTVASLWGLALSYGGPVCAFWSWVGGGCLMVLITMTMGELVSAFPMSGAMYWWTAVLTQRSKLPVLAPFLSLVACYCNLLGQVLLLSGFEQGLVYQTATAVQLITTTPASKGYMMSRGMQIYLCLMFSASHAVINCLPLKRIGQAAVWLTGGVMLVCLIEGTLLFLPFTVVHEVQNVSETLFRYETQAPTLPLPQLISLSFIMVIAGTTGYDAPAHLVEEVHSADVTVPYSMVLSMVGSVAAGAVLIAGLNANTADIPSLFDPGNATGGNAFLQVWHDRTAGATYSHFCDVLAITSLCIVGFLNAVFAMTAASRMLWAFSRDNLVPGSKYMRRLDKISQTPATATWVLATAASLLYLISVFSPLGSSITTGLQQGSLLFSYLMPVTIRALIPDEAWEPGPFSLGRWSRPVAVVSMLWLLAQLVMSSLPEVYPITLETLNWCAPALGSVLVSMAVLWMVFLRHYITGPETEFTNSDLLKTWHMMDPPRPTGIFAKNASQNTRNLLRKSPNRTQESDASNSGGGLFRMGSLWWRS